MRQNSFNCYRPPFNPARCFDSACVQRCSNTSERCDICNELTLNPDGGSQADTLRDVAINCEKDNRLEDAYKLMKIAHIIRPNGLFIKQKLDEYSKALSLT